MRLRITATLATALMLAATTAATTAAAIPPVTHHQCFDGPNDINAAASGDICWTGGVMWLTESPDGHPAYIWGLALFPHLGLRHVVIKSDRTKSANEMRVVLAGYVRDVRPYWPFTNPKLDRQLCETEWGMRKFCPAVVNIYFIGDKPEQHRPPCVQDLSITPEGHAAVYTWPCSAEQQGGKDKFSTFMIWEPGHRIVGVKLTNAHTHGSQLHPFCLAGGPPPEQDQYIGWDPEIKEAEPWQLWYEDNKPLDG